MKKNFALFLIGSLLISFLITQGYSETAKQVLDKIIEAQGGRDLLSKINDQTFSGSMEMIQMGLSGSITMYQKRPNKLRMDMEVMGMMITQAYDGEIAWMTNFQTGNAEELPERMAEDLRRQAIGDDALLNPEKYGITFALKDKETIEGKDYIVLEQTFSDGYKVILYIDPETYLAYKTKAKAFNQMGVEVESETLLSDYKEIKGMMLPHSIIIYQDGEEFLQMTVTETSFNTNLEDAMFKMSE